jgi:myo-inositol-1(or 4)-monophosphatase
MSKPASDLKSVHAALVKAALASGKVLRHYYGQALKISEKQGAGLVTDADVASEKAAMKILRKARPDFEMLTEESAPHVSDRAKGIIENGSEKGAKKNTKHLKPNFKEEGFGRWIMDPLDGTTNFIHGYPMFCISIAAEWNGTIWAGVIHHPIFNETYSAIKGQGAWMTRQGRKSRMRVSKTARLPDTLLTTGFSYRKDEWLHAEMEAFERLSGVARAIRRPGSAALDLAYTARGVFDGFWERRLSPWDVAAGALLVEEAGGIVTDFQGDPFRIDGHEILASNRKLHSDLLDTIAPELCPLPQSPHRPENVV